jgi:hypothetical protein
MDVFCAEGSFKTTEFQGPETSNQAAVLLGSRNSQSVLSRRHRATRSRSSLMAASNAESISDAVVVVGIPFLSGNGAVVVVTDGISLDGIVLVETELDFPQLAPGADASTMMIVYWNGSSSSRGLYWMDPTSKATSGIEFNTVTPPVDSGET